MKKITGIFVDPTKQIIEKRTIDNDIKSFYELLNCNCVDIAIRRIEGIIVRIVCDDEGRIKSDNIIPSLVSGFNRAYDLFGSIFICDFDGLEDLCSLSDAAIMKILHSERNFLTPIGIFKAIYAAT